MNPMLKAFLRFGGKQFVSLFSSSPTRALNYFLQSVFFGLAISSIVVLILKLIRFSYAKYIVNNRIFKLAVIALFFYSKIWDQWSSWFIAIGYACAIFMCIYTYDCSLNIAQYYTNKVRGYYWIQVSLYSIITIIIPLLIIKTKVKEYSTNMFMFLVAQILIIIVLNAIKNQHFIFSTIPSALVLSIVILRHVFESNSFTNTLALQTVPMIMMAFDAEFRQNKENNRNRQKKQQINESVIVQLLKFCVSFLIYTNLNGNSVYIEHSYAAVHIIISLIKFKG